MITGVDVHPKYQANLMPRARDSFVIVKATEGRTVSYPTRPAYVKRFRDAGKIIGHYHWLHTGNIQAQVDWFASKAQVQPGDLIAIDWEHGNPTVPVADVNAAVRLMRAKFPRNRLLVYTFSCYGPAWAARYKVSVADGLWIADYRSRSNQLGRPHGCDGQPMPVSWFMWQYTTNGQTLDENRVPQFSSQAEMRTWARGLIPKPPPAPKPLSLPVFQSAHGPYHKVPTGSGGTTAVCPEMYAAVTRAFALAGLSSGLVWIKGGLQPRTSVSADTHAELCVADIRTRNMTTAETWRVATWLLRCGVIGNIRGVKDTMDPHIHGVMANPVHAHSSAKAQVKEYRAGGDGLIGEKPYYGPKVAFVTWENSAYNPKNAKNDSEDWLDMATKEDVKKAIREVLAEDGNMPNPGGRFLADGGPTVSYKSTLAGLGRLSASIIAKVDSARRGSDGGIAILRKELATRTDRLATAVNAGNLAETATQDEIRAAVASLQETLTALDPEPEEPPVEEPEDPEPEEPSVQA